MTDVGVLAQRGAGRLGLSRFVRPATIVFFGVLPALTIVMVFVAVVQDDSVAMDFRQFYAAAEFILRGKNPYPEGSGILAAWGGPFPYPPLPALLADASYRAVRARPPDSCVMVMPRPRRTRDPVRPRRPRLALLRARACCGHR